MVGGWGQSPPPPAVNPLKKAEEAPAVSVEVALGWIWAVVLVSPPVGGLPGWSELPAPPAVTPRHHSGNSAVLRAGRTFQKLTVGLSPALPTL